MASFSAFNTLQQKQLLSINLSKYPYFLSCVFTSSTLKHKFHQEYTLQQPFHIKNSAIMCSVEHKTPTEPLDSMNKRDLRYGFSSLRSRSDKVGGKAKSSLVVEEKMVKVKKYRRKREFTSGFSSLGSNRKIEVMSKDRGEIGEEKIIEKCQQGEEVEKKGRKRRKAKIETPESRLRKGLDMCSKKGDFESAISLYDSAVGEGVQLEQYHYTVLLYLCSSAAVGVVRPAKSGKGTGSSFKLDYIDNVPSVNSCNDSPDVSLGSEDSGNRGSFDFSGRHNLSSSNLVEMNSFNLEAGKNVILEPKDVHNLYDKRSDRSCDSLNGAITMRNDGERDEHDHKIQVSEDVKRYALARGFEIYEKMCSENIPLNEATLTSVARMAMSMGDGDMALDMVNKMKEVGIRPRLRSYGPALFTFCNCGDIEKAFMVEEHMLENGVYAEEPELEALLRLSVEAGRGDKVYKVLHTLRKSIRKVSTSTADLIERWFRGKSASRVGKRKWDKNLIIEAMKNRGGGWHGQGWLGRGKWTTARTVIGNDGFCEHCGDKLVIIDLDPTETENFAESVAALAFKRERESSFQNFQKWLDYYGPFEAVVDAANVGLYKQRQFSPSKVNVVVNGIRQKLPSKKWPLIVLHNKRITGGKMEEPSNKILFEKWKNADALYATPTGSNDDWYWLYAAIKFKCLLVTNDEMRDHLFQLLGNDFFPRWKERHQVRFGFSERGLDLYMPPPCSVVIQESEEGHWHIPIASEDGSERDRTWLCVTRTSPESHESPRSHKEATYQDSEGHVKADTENWRKMKLRNRRISKDIQKKQQLKRIYSGLKSILSEHVLPNDRGLVSAIEEAEKLGGCVIDFQI